MTIEQFKTVLRQQPFKPFTIRMADGRTVQVAHPDFVAQSQSGRRVIVIQPDDSFSELDLLSMTELQLSNVEPA